MKANTVWECLQPPTIARAIADIEQSRVVADLTTLQERELKAARTELAMLMGSEKDAQALIDEMH